MYAPTIMGDGIMRTMGRKIQTCNAGLWSHARLNGTAPRHIMPTLLECQASRTADCALGVAGTRKMSLKSVRARMRGRT